MTRTSIDIDDGLVAEVIRQNGLKSKREAVDFALRRAVRRRLSTDELLALEGAVPWDGDLGAMRDDPGLVQWSTWSTPPHGPVSARDGFVRSLVDCQIAAVALRHQATVVHQDAYLELIANLTELRHESWR